MTITKTSEVIAQIIGRKLSGLERLYVRGKTCMGMVNVYDIIQAGRRIGLFN
jgi:hypothetical protein